MSTIRRQVNIATSPRTVWNALTTAEGLSRWLVSEARVDPRQGGRMVLKLRADDGAPTEEAGFLHVWRPTAKLEVNWDKASPGPWRGTFTQFHVAKDGPETILHVNHAGPAFEDEEARLRVDGFWRKALTALRDQLEAG